MHKEMKRALLTAETLGREISRAEVISPYDCLLGYAREDLEYLVGKSAVLEIIESGSAELVKEMEMLLSEGDCRGVTCEVKKGGAKGVVVDYLEGVWQPSRAFLVVKGNGELSWEKEVVARAPKGSELETISSYEVRSFQRGDRVEKVTTGDEGVVVDEKGLGEGYFTRRLVRWRGSVLESLESVHILK